ncbi:hypothetical protein UFOVP612_30 [uncultured Caudovirales phage]|uniref:Uncharacterized protein n=1 Tax=uncultured Caudovirales phage TaxID=2100421 RepID=A0A6J5N4C7_9CAUD|nr:hypothetical protein UFOVP612_30 [uncultured Caudovirales phage]
MSIAIVEVQSSSGAVSTVEVESNGQAVAVVEVGSTGQGIAIIELNQGPAGSSATVDQTIIDGSANAVSGNAVFDALALKAPIANPTFTGIVTAPRITGRCDGLEVLCKAGLAINAGQVVYGTGASGNNIIIGLARANAESTSSKTLGISESTLAHNAFGYVITEGIMTVSISAPTANEGDPIWLSSATAGGMVFGLANKPSAPNHIVYLGVVTRKTGNTVVEIYVKIQNGAELDELSDVALTNPVAGQALMRGATLWENRSLVSSDISDATSAATASKIVLRDTSGGANFAAVGATSVTSTGAISTTGINGYISTSGYDANITTTGDNAFISTIGDTASISTSGYDASIYTSGFAANIFTSGQFGFIFTSGNDAQIYTNGTDAHIATQGINAYIQSRSTFKLFNGTYTTTLSHSPTANRAIAFPNAGGTVALTSGSQTFSGAQTFSGQVELTGQAATNGTSAMTRDLADNRLALNHLRGLYIWSNRSTDYTATHVGTGAASTNIDVLDLSSGLTAGSVSFLRSNIFNFRVWHVSLGSGRGIVNWSLRTVYNLRIYITDITGADTVVRFLLGQVYTNTTAQDLTSSNKGIGFKIINGLVYVQVANATTLTTTSTSTTLASLTEYDLTIDSNGSGSWVAYINGSNVASGTGAPTGNSSSGHNALCMSNTNGTTAAIRQLYVVSQKTLQIP